MTMVIVRAGWLSGIEERCLLSRLSWVFCVTLLLHICESSCVVGEHQGAENPIIKRNHGLKAWLRKPVRCCTFCCRESIAVEPAAMRALWWHQGTVTVEGCQG